ncbi:hypothetical protein [Lentzea nigeriaca]|uniref:hypothetical protein n=1 Tax=Lentzea nigeriaca TaxID=1128665 RepID=UPI00195DD3A5|nr:hypothetical protein [Lentzea nigeriaca]MBM7862701.1 hypothetical protein [Lentzea nigeriaca]
MSEQGQAPPPQEPPRDGAQNEPQAARPAPEQATTPLPADASATPGPQPAAEQPAAAGPQAPAAPQAAAQVPPPAAPAPPGRVRRFAGHRATQLVAAGLLGLILGGGIVGAIAANRFDHRGPGHVRVHDRGPDRGDHRGDRFEQRGPFSDRGDRFER